MLPCRGMLQLTLTGLPISSLDAVELDDSGGGKIYKYY